MIVSAKEVRHRFQPGMGAESVFHMEPTWKEKISLMETTSIIQLNCCCGIVSA